MFVFRFFQIASSVNVVRIAKCNMLIQTLKLHALTQIIYGTNCVIFYLTFLIFHHLLQSAIFGLNFFILNNLLFTLKILGLVANYTLNI